MLICSPDSGAAHLQCAWVMMLGMVNTLPRKLCWAWGLFPCEARHRIWVYTMKTNTTAELRVRRASEQHITYRYIAPGGNQAMCRLGYHIPQLRPSVARPAEPVLWTQQGITLWGEKLFLIGQACFHFSSRRLCLKKALAPGRVSWWALEVSSFGCDSVNPSPAEVLPIPLSHSISSSVNETPIIHKVGLFMMSQMPWMFCDWMF